MLEAARHLSNRLQNVSFIISLAPSVERKFVEKIVEKHFKIADFEYSSEYVGKVFEKSRLVIAVSGTVTLEAALAGAPMVIIC